MVLSIIVSAGLIIARIYVGPIILWVVLATMFFSISLKAVVRTSFGTVNGPEWSIDCIWYNALLGSNYVIAAFLTYHIMKRNRIIIE